MMSSNARDLLQIIESMSQVQMLLEIRVDLTDLSIVGTSKINLKVTFLCFATETQNPVGTQLKRIWRTVQ